MNSAATFTQFATAINHHDVSALAALMTPDHIFIDSLANRAQGSIAMEAGWRGNFAIAVWRNSEYLPTTSRFTKS